jgi:heme/copper-type cytochrome/quinol oxidase subunit 3|tara:strand:- start:451 stop:786 length:336 start_codon:yes stop_codon:yes gene_type:complete
LVNTLILLLSGATVTWSHNAIVAGYRKPAILGLIFTVILAVIFTSLQAFEYYGAPFTISDGIYGSTFFMATGFHGFHVFVGTCFLAICAIRLYNHHFTQEHHFGFEAAAWY